MGHGKGTAGCLQTDAHVRLWAGLVGKHVSAGNGPTAPAPGRLPATHPQVCNERFDDIAATVVCRQLGLPTPGRMLGPGYFGAGAYTSRIWLTGVACSGDETRLPDCPHNTWGTRVASCTHAKVGGLGGARRFVRACRRRIASTRFLQKCSTCQPRAGTVLQHVVEMHGIGSCNRLLHPCALLHHLHTQDVGIACGLEARLPACTGSGSACTGGWRTALQHACVASLAVKCMFSWKGCGQQT